VVDGENGLHHVKIEWEFSGRGKCPGGICPGGYVHGKCPEICLSNKPLHNHTHVFV